MLPVLRPRLVRLLRLRLSLTREALAQRLGHSPQLVHQWESGRLVPGAAAQAYLLAAADRAKVDFAALEALVAVVEMIGRGDAEIALHAARVSLLGEQVAQSAGDFAYDLAVAGFLHDAGKVMLPPSILGHPGGLSVDERLIIQAHVAASANLARLLAGDAVARYVAEHHERLDGTGYPNGLCRDQISHGGRILAICDEYVARTSLRGYRPAAQRPDEALDEMEQHPGFDASLVHALRAVLREDPTARRAA